MKKIRLLPFVFKIKGARNYALYDLLNRRLFQVLPEGDLEELKKFLFEKRLAIDTECVIPFRFQNNVSNYKEEMIIKELQIRITGECTANCQECGNLCMCFKGGRDISVAILTKLIEQLRYIKIHEVVITGGNPILLPNELKMIKEGIQASHYKLLTRATLNEVETLRWNDFGFRIVSNHKYIPEITENKMKVDTFSFFFNQVSNPCIGNVVAIDTDGTIKPCLWAAENLGNVQGNTIKDLIIAGIFDKYWDLSKDKITTCMDCEFRYGCPDCRVSVLKQSQVLTAKTTGCQYEPNAV